MIHLLGIDIGTTNTKIIIFTENGEIVEERAFPTPFISDEYGGCYQPQEVFSVLLENLKSFSSDAKKEVAALSISSFAEVMVGLDQFLQPITKSPAWFDTRTDFIFHEMKDTINSDKIYRLTGLSPQSKYSFYKLIWHRAVEPEIFQSVRFWTSMSGYVLAALSGVLSFDYSLASRTMFFDQHNRQWSQELLEIIGVPLKKMSHLTPSGIVLGKIRKEIAQFTGLPENLQIVTGGHDHLCAAVAVGVFQQGQVLISTGTTENLTMALDAIPQINLSQLKRSFSWGHHAIPERYYGMSGIYSGGYSLEWFLKLVNESYQYLKDLPQEIPKEVSLFYPYLLGADYDGARGALINLEGKMEKPDLTKSLIISLSFEYKDLWDIMAQNLNIHVERVTNVGGGTQNDFWMKVKSAVLNEKILVPQDKEGSCKGAAILAGLAVGLYAEPEDAYRRTFHLAKIYEPDPELRESLLPWYGLYIDLRDDIRHLNEKMKRIYMERRK